MGSLHRALAPWAVLLLALQLAGASHVVHQSLEVEAAAPSVPASLVSPLLRTGYHFQPPKNWINETEVQIMYQNLELTFLPAGNLCTAAPMYHKGWYHLFYQYNPDGAVWGNIVWAHSVSRDLINWISLEPAIVPSIPSDRYGCWSGSATILPGGTPAIMYTGITRADIGYEVQNIAFPKNKSDPLLREWVKPAGINPIAAPEDGINATQFRDPTTAWFADGHWRMLVGGARNDRGLAFLYRSKDFEHWVRAKHPLHSALTGMWECPDFFPVAGAGEQHGLDTSEPGVKHVLKNSLDRLRYDKATDRYVPDDPNGDQHRLRYDYGNFYASKTFYDPGIPRKIWLDPSGKQLLQWPIEELEELRGQAVRVDGKVIKPGHHFEITGLRVNQVGSCNR
ncbi:hypothetical protein EJB05_21429, partial [Eragrostis curvula]